MHKLLITLSFLGLISVASANDSELLEKKENIEFQKSGPELWAETCTRCHNAPSSMEFSDDEWDILAKHMKIRAQIPDEDMKKILEFLKIH